jgi:hypothetical protein
MTRAQSPYLNRVRREFAEVRAARARTAAPRLVRRAIVVSRAAARRGNAAAARRAWSIAARFAMRCGGISGSAPAGGGYAGIVLQDGLVAVSPVPMLRHPLDAPSLPRVVRIAA